MDPAFKSKLDKIGTAISALLGIIEDELAHDPEPDDLTSWKRAIKEGYEALEILQKVGAAPKKGDKCPSCKKGVLTAKGDALICERCMTTWNAKASVSGRPDVEAKFLNRYMCPKCGHLWCDVWDSTCDDDCPNCGERHISPYESEDV